MSVSVVEALTCLSKLCYQLYVYFQNLADERVRKRVAADPCGVLVSQLNPSDDAGTQVDGDDGTSGNG